MRSVAERPGRPFVNLWLAAFLPGWAFGATATSSMEVSVQVVRAGASTAPAALVQAAETRDPGRAAINSDAECRAMGNVVVVDGALASCRWDAESHTYWVTVQY